MARAFSFEVTVGQVGPASDPVYLRAPKAVKDEVNRWIGIYGLKEKDAELAAGLDRRGVPMRAVLATTARNRVSEMGPADPGAPPLMPAYGASRTRLLLTSELTDRGARFFWEFDPLTGDSWGQILDYHRKGVGKRKIKRDVIGISPQALERVRRQVMRRWNEWKLRGFPSDAPDIRRPIPVAQANLPRRGPAPSPVAVFGIGGEDRARPGEQSTGRFQRVSAPREPFGPARGWRRFWDMFWGR